MSEKDDLETMAEDLVLASDQYKGLAEVWDKLDSEQRVAVRRLYRRAEHLIRDLCRVWGAYDLPRLPRPWEQEK